MFKTQGIGQIIYKEEGVAWIELKKQNISGYF